MGVAVEAPLMSMTWTSSGKAGQTPEQFYYKTRKKGFGPFKRELWSLGEDVKGPILRSLEERFELLMRRLGCEGSAATIRKFAG